MLTKTGGGNFVVSYLLNNLKAFVLSKDNSNVVLWFLIALFYCKLFTDITNKYRWTIALFAGLFIAVIVTRRSYFYIGQGLMALPFYLMGSACRDAILKLSYKKSSWSWILPLMCISVTLSLFNGRVSMSGLNLGSLSIFWLSPIIFYFNAICGSLAFLLLSKYIDFPIVNKVAHSLISVLGLQMILIVVFKQYLGDNPNYGLAVVSSLLIMAACHIIHKYLISKII